MRNAIFTRRAPLRIVKRRGEKSRGVRNEVQKTLVLGSVVRKAPSALVTREEGEGETPSEWFILILFLLCPATRRWRFIDFSLGRPSWCSPDIINVTCRVRSSFCVSRRDEKRLTTIHGRYYRWCSDRSHFALKLWRNRIYLCPSRADKNSRNSKV